MNTCAQDIVTLLEGISSLALSPGVDLFIGPMPDSPDECVSVTDSPGTEPDPNNYYNDSIQVLVRGEVGGYADASALAADIATELHQYTGQPDVYSAVYTLVWQTSSPFFIGTDENNRPLFSTNYRIQRR